MTMPKPLSPERYVVLGRTPKFRRPLPFNVTICRASELSKCVHEVPRRSVFISFQRDLTDALLRAGLRAGLGTRFAELVTIQPPRAASVPSLFGLFQGVTGAAAAYRWLPAEELLTVITGKDAANRFIGGVADHESETVALVRGNLRTVVVPFSFFEPSGDGVTPDFGALSFTDYGHTVAFGEYEASADAIMYEVDEDYRRKLNKERKLNERGFGASLRRLRLQRRLKRGDFPGVSSKTIARIERGDVEKPHGKTLEMIAQQLGVTPEEIESF
jgi:hypothetical protein